MLQLNIFCVTTKSVLFSCNATVMVVANSYLMSTTSILTIPDTLRSSTALHGASKAHFRVFRTALQLNIRKYLLATTLDISGIRFFLHMPPVLGWTLISVAQLCEFFFQKLLLLIFLFAILCPNYR